MPIEILSGANREGYVGQSLRHPITARVTMPAGGATPGQPVPQVDVYFSAEIPETLEFEGGRGYAVAKTDARGIAEVNVGLLKPGNHKYRVASGTEHADGTVAATDTGVRQLDGVTAVPTADGDVQLFRSRDLREPTRPRRPSIIIV